MFKAIKNNKIIATNETGIFPCLVYDNIEQDAEHTVADYIQVNGEFVLTTDDRASAQKADEIRAERDKQIERWRWRIERYQTQEAAGLDTTDTAEYYKALLLYIQALRDIPTQAGFPDAVEWPEEPTDNTATPAKN